GIVGNVNRLGRRTRGIRLAFTLALLLTSTRAFAETHCRAPIDGSPALADIDGRARLDWINQRLSHDGHRMAVWNWGWAIGIGAAGVGTLIPVPFVAPENRVDYYTGAVLAGLGVLPFVLAPPKVIEDSQTLRARLERQPPRNDQEVCALLADAEARLIRDARNEHLMDGWWAHAANVAINGAGFLFLGLGYHHWTSAIANGLAGVAIGEAVIFTQPTGSIDSRDHYLRADLLPPDGH
ncbi:MAG TPA: hypothetical protein VHG72_07040, partial [Polyangia bacterium]|nr:hypothetical protein [Polyangia bacterium]